MICGRGDLSPTGDDFMVTINPVGANCVRPRDAKDVVPYNKNKKEDEK